MTNKEKCIAKHDFIIKNWAQYSNPEMAKMIGISLTSYRNYVYSLGLKKQQKNYWKKEEVEFLKANYKIMGDMELGEKLGRTNRSVEKKRKYLKLRRTKRQIFKITSHRAKQPGKGFPKGHIAPGHRKIGERWKIKNCKYWYIKTKYGTYLEHRWLWIWNFGEIEKGEVVVFRDGDTDNLNLDNLAITSRKDVAKYNTISRTEAHKKALKMSFLDRVYAGYTPEFTEKGIVYH